MEVGIQLRGQINQIDVGPNLLAEAAAAYKANPYDNSAKHPMAFLDAKLSADLGPDEALPSQQLYAQLGLNDGNIRLADALDGKRLLKGAATEDGSITGRMVTLPYLFDAIESSLRLNDYGITSIFSRMAAQVDSIASTKFERPIIDYRRPASARAQRISQLAEPVGMALLEVSDTAHAIPAVSLGLEYSDQAAQKVALNIVQLSLNRQAEEANLERVEDNLLSFLLGNPDMGMLPLANIPGAVVDATDLDPDLTKGLSHLAWQQWMFDNTRKRTLNTIVTDFAGVRAIEMRSGRPTVVQDYGKDPQINTFERILNPSWPKNVEIILVQDPRWPAGTIMGFDRRYGYHLVNSTVLAYEAMQRDSIRRGTKMRFDSGSVAYRLYDDAWSVLEYPV